MYTAFLKKELTESSRTHKLLILVIVFLLFGIMSPVTAKILPDIMSSVMPEDMILTLPTPTALDSWGQFFKNVSQMGLIVVVLVFGGIMAGEFSKGTLVNMLTKGLSRPVVILSKFTSAVLIWTAIYALCFGVAYAYTAYFWSMDNVSNLFLSTAGLWVYGVLLITELILGGILFKGNYGGLLFTFGLVAVTLLVSIAPTWNKYNPISCGNLNTGLLSGQVAPADFYPAMIVCGGLIALFLTAAILVFNKKQV
ncbi:MAG TPA: ABC transporter permease [Oscillospiraceae bacterium]|nr:ABC transporter permease [Oscillospiraceae bacterium]HPF55910.1 ABC transporter permease [Clostridiales bacterium]HPK35242.1 ABC transporter permease [Oscillospiraceae bacterium]HPR75435.1 ABC transporter permease [Oscillospiraceae bacterium]